jgi:hypothetical protein
MPDLIGCNVILRQANDAGRFDPGTIPAIGHEQRFDHVSTPRVLRGDQARVTDVRVKTGYR